MGTAGDVTLTRVEPSTSILDKHYPDIRSNFVL